MKKSFLALLMVPCTLLATNVTYTPDNTTIFPNPERGFYHHTEQKVKDGTTNLSTSTFTTARNSGHTLLLRMYYLDNFRSKDLSQAVLDQITNDFALFRQNGCKAILRFSYTATDDENRTKDSNPTWWGKHIAQLKPILQANADVIAVVQAGFIGAWGEWYYSSQGVGDDIPLATKAALIDELLDAVPVSRCICLRTPYYKQKYIGNSVPLSADEAFTGTPKARLGHHNDAFLYQSDNMGTYRDRTKDMNYLAQECLYLPNGGETDVYKESVYQEWATGDKAQAEMAKLHYSYLNQGYCELTLNHWRQDGSFDILDRNMGYRFQLVNATFPDNATAGETLDVEINIANVGYASPYNERHAFLILKNDKHAYALPIQSDPRFWHSGKTTTISEQLYIPYTVQPGTYSLYLHLPDAYQSIADDPRFAIRLANQNVWDEQTGYNSLNAQVTIANDSPIEDALSEPIATKQVVKQIRNGRLCITANGSMYDVLGNKIQ